VGCDGVHWHSSRVLRGCSEVFVAHLAEDVTAKLVVSGFLDWLAVHCKSPH
jgi:hypothetical protein